MKVGVNYFPCYPEWWAARHDPLLGQYSTSDGEVVARHCGWLWWAGIDFLVVSYFWDKHWDYEEKLRQLMRKISMPYCLQVECGSRTDEEVLQMLEYVELHVKSPDYFRVCGLPLIVGYEPAKPFEEMGWQNPGWAVRYMNRYLGGWRTWRLLERFDESDPPNPWREQIGVAPGCVPGNHPRDLELFRGRLRTAITMRPKFLTIYSWNEWIENAQVEPSESEGDAYIRVLREELQVHES